MAVARSDEGSSNVTRKRPAAASPADPTRQTPAARRRLRLDDLYRLPMPNLFALAEREGIAEHTGMNRGQLIMAVVRHQIERGAVVRGSGTLEVLPDGYGFLRSVAHNYLASPEDIYVSPSQIRRLGLRTGLVVEGPIRLPVEGQDNFALMQVDLVNGHSPDERVGRDRLRGPDAAAPQPPARAGDRPREELRHARRRPGHADRQGAARPDRLAAARRQDDPACRRSP